MYQQALLLPRIIKAGDRGRIHVTRVISNICRVFPTSITGMSKL